MLGSKFARVICGSSAEYLHLTARTLQRQGSSKNGRAYDISFGFKLFAPPEGHIRRPNAGRFVDQIKHKMVPKPRLAPPFEAAAAVTAVAAQRPRFVRSRTTSTTSRTRRRERSRSRDSRPTEKRRQGRRRRALLGAILAVLVFCAALGLRRHRQRRHDVKQGQEASRLRREVADLEEALRRKETLLGMLPGSPLGNRNAGGGAGVRGNDAQVVDQSQPGLIREPVPLIVGGSDGSGTRGVVALLQRLRVPMVVEDRGTMDVHGSPYMVQGGWPAVVRPVLEWARGAWYESRAAPDGLRRSTFGALDGLKAQMQKVQEGSRNIFRMR